MGLSGQILTKWVSYPYWLSTAGLFGFQIGLITMSALLYIVLSAKFKYSQKQVD
jgi:tetrahydromethanopterin S-methyltransferase subunit B